MTAGLLELRWSLVCPSCRTANAEVETLAAIGDASHCQLCDLTYGIDLDRAVEATFVPHPSVREVKRQMFCVGGPWRTPHVVVQAVAPPSGERALDAPAEAGRHRIFARGGAVASLEVALDAPRETRVVLADGKLAPSETRVRPGGVVVFENATDAPLHVKIERLAYASLAATAHDLTTMGEFRRLFSRDLVKPGTPLKVASCAILFSDLTGSTALYSRAGDAAAFRLVDDHFDVLRRVIDAHGGAVVKTMGDAVMAAFVEPLACVRAAIACLHAFETFGSTRDGASRDQLGSSGPCTSPATRDDTRATEWPGVTWPSGDFQRAGSPEGRELYIRYRYGYPPLGNHQFEVGPRGKCRY